MSTHVIGLRYPAILLGGEEAKVHEKFVSVNEISNISPAEEALQMKRRNWEIKHGRIVEDRSLCRTQISQDSRKVVAGATVENVKFLWLHWLHSSTSDPSTDQRPDGAESEKMVISFAQGDGQHR